jgi:toxin ParE1/3/4
MRVRFTTDARSDLDEIFTYLGAESPAAAEAVLVRLYDACRQLGEAPRQYAVALTRRKSEIRRRAVGSYNIYFRIVDDNVEIVRVVHAARDATRFLNDD